MDGVDGLLVVEHAQYSDQLRPILPVVVVGPVDVVGSVLRLELLPVHVDVLELVQVGKLSADAVATIFPVVVLQSRCFFSS